MHAAFTTSALLAQLREKLVGVGVIISILLAQPEAGGKVRPPSLKFSFRFEMYFHSMPLLMASRAYETPRRQIEITNPCFKYVSNKCDGESRNTYWLKHVCNQYEGGSKQTYLPNCLCIFLARDHGIC